MQEKRLKYLGINLTKDANDLYNDNYKTFLGEIEEGTKKKERCSMFMDWKINIVKNGHITQSNIQIKCKPY